MVPRAIPPASCPVGPPGLRLRPAGPIVRELHPSLSIRSTAFIPRHHGWVLANVRSTVGAKRKTPEDLGWSVTSGGRQDSGVAKEGIPPKGNAHHL